MRADFPTEANAENMLTDGAFACAKFSGLVVMRAY